MSSAAEILKEVKPFIEEAVAVHVIIKGLRAARDLVSRQAHPEDTQLMVRPSRRSRRLPSQ